MSHPNTICEQNPAYIHDDSPCNCLEKPAKRSEYEQGYSKGWQEGYKKGIAQGYSDGWNDSAEVFA